VIDTHTGVRHTVQDRLIPPSPRDAAYDGAHQVHYSLGADSSGVLWLFAEYGQLNLTVTIGSTGILVSPTPIKLAYQPTTGMLYGIENTHVQSWIYRIDPATAMTTVGPMAPIDDMADFCWNQDYSAL
jgi:hypothetical protein